METSHAHQCTAYILVPLAFATCIPVVYLTEEDEENHACIMYLYMHIIFFFVSVLLSSFWISCVVSGVVPSPPRYMPSVFIAHRVQHSPCSSTSHGKLQTHVFAISASPFVHMKKFPRTYTSRGTRTHAIDLYTRISCYRSIPPGRPAYVYGGTSYSPYTILCVNCSAIDDDTPPTKANESQQQQAV